MGAIKVVDIAFVRFAAPDFAEMCRFLDDFGMAHFEAKDRLYAKGGDGRPFLHVTELGAPAFLGVGFRAAAVGDLEVLAQIYGAPVEDLAEPGGGKIVRFVDPDGFRVEVVAGQVVSPPGAGPDDSPRNTLSHRERLRKTVRLTPGPAHVHRLGHCVLNVSDFRTSERWYKDRFGFLTSDEIEAANDMPMGAFMRCDRGDEPSDHHTLFLAQLPQKPGFLHAAFEVANLDDLMLGHAHLKAKGHTQVWGVGRHIMGSQIFDYWKDPWGHELEHWTDGDLLTAADPPVKTPFENLLAVQWGAPHPIFAGRRPPPKRLVSLFMALQLRLRRLFRRDLKAQVR
jgi:catechol 2,3-dioxygenase-like lactoylglutathione lyase family enzyme